MGASGPKRPELQLSRARCAPVQKDTRFFLSGKKVQSGPPRVSRSLPVSLVSPEPQAKARRYRDELLSSRVRPFGLVAQQSGPGLTLAMTRSDLRDPRGAGVGPTARTRPEFSLCSVMSVLVLVSVVEPSHTVVWHWLLSEHTCTTSSNTYGADDATRLETGPGGADRTRSRWGIGRAVGVRATSR